MARAATPVIVRLGVLAFGSLQWIAAVIADQRLDAQHGFTLETTTLANTEAVKVALLGRSVDVGMSDWPFVVAQRSRGGRLCFAAGASNCLGGIMVPAASPVHKLADLKGLRLGVAGGPADKSWLLARAAGLREGIDLVVATKLAYGAPPLLEALLRRGELDALLTFWNFTARLEASGFREALSVADCARQLGLNEPPELVGYVFDSSWAHANRPAIDGFLAAARAATGILATSDSEWSRVRPLMNAPTEAVFQNLRRRFVAGITHLSASAIAAQAVHIQSLLAADGLLSGSPTFPPGVFWPNVNAS